MLFRCVILIFAALCASVAFAIPADNLKIYPRGDVARSVRMLQRSSPIKRRDAGHYLDARSFPVFISRRSSHSSSGNLDMSVLTAREREIICQYFIEGLTVKEIATKMELPVKLVQSVMCSGVKKLASQK